MDPPLALAPPPDPPGTPLFGNADSDLPPPAPADIIVEKLEFEPDPPLVVSVPGVPPPPTTTG